MQVVDVLEVSIPIWDKAMLAQIVMLVMVVFLLRKLSDNRNNYYFSWHRLKSNIQSLLRTNPNKEAE